MKRFTVYDIPALGLTGLAAFGLYCAITTAGVASWVSLTFSLAASFGVLAILRWIGVHKLTTVAGDVVEHCFEPAYRLSGIVSITTVPSVAVLPRIVPPVWKLLIQDEAGRQTWVTFDHDVFETYPVGSFYEQ